MAEGDISVELEGSDDDTDVFLTQTPSGANILDNAVEDIDLEGMFESSKDSGNASFEGLEVEGAKTVSSPKPYEPELEAVSDEEESGFDFAAFVDGDPEGCSTQSTATPATKEKLKGDEGGVKSNSGPARMIGAISKMGGKVKGVVGAASRQKGRSYNERLGKDQLEGMKTKKYAKNTTKKYTWMVNSYIKWRADCIETVGAEQCDSDILASDLENPKLLEKGVFCTAMCKFITETKKCNGEDYPPNTIRGIVLGIQMYLTTFRIYWKLLGSEDPEFRDLYYVTDNVMKERLANGLGVVQSATPILCSQEEIMWDTGVLGEHNATQLCETLLFLIGVNFALRGGDEHKKLRRPGFEPQIKLFTDSDGVKCLRYVEDPQSKTNQGGLTGKSAPPKVVHCYPNDEHPERCLYRLYQKYVGLLPKTGKHSDLYMHAKRKQLPNLWYDDRCLGINTLREIVKRLCHLSGFKEGKFVNHSLRSSTGTRMYDGELDEQLIQETTGHRSSAVRMYKRTSDKLRRKASAIVQGRSVVEVPEKVKDKVETDTKPSVEQGSDLSDFEPPKTEIRTPLKRKLENQSVSDINLGALVGNVSGGRKYKKVKISLEFTDSD